MLGNITGFGSHELSVCVCVCVEGLCVYDKANTRSFGPKMDIMSVA